MGNVKQITNILYYMMIILFYAISIIIGVILGAAFGPFILTNTIKSSLFERGKNKQKTSNITGMDENPFQF